MASQGIAEMRNQARPLTAGSSATTRSKQAPWTELLYEVHTHLLSICNDITKNQRLCEGCDNLIKATRDPVRQNHVAVTKEFAQSTLDTLKIKLVRLNGAIHRAVYEGLLTLENMEGSVRRPEQLLTPSTRRRQQAKPKAVRYTLPMVALPWKHKARSLNLKAHISRVLQEHYLENPARFSREFEELSIAYTKATHFSVRENRITSCITYYYYLQDFEIRCCYEGAAPQGASFAWFDPFSGYEIVTDDLRDEKLAALYNAAVICTQVAAYYENQDAAGVKRAGKLYEQAAGILKHVLDSGLVHETRQDGLSISTMRETIEILHDLLLAQAQESLWRYLIQCKASMTNQSLAGEAASVAWLYSSLADRLLVAVHAEYFPSGWTTLVLSKASFFSAMADYHFWLSSRVDVVSEETKAIADAGHLARAMKLLTEAEEQCKLDNKYGQLAVFLDEIQAAGNNIRQELDTIDSSSISFSAHEGLEEVTPTPARWAEASQQLLTSCKTDDLLRALGPAGFFNARQPLRYRETITVAKMPDESPGFNLVGSFPCCINEVLEESPAELGGLRPDSFLLTVNGVDVRALPLEEVAHLLARTESPLRLTVVRTVLDPADADRESHASTNHGSQAYSCF
eukprot:m.122020 g.122020  ORF g.122020 m.122020 type:complete len:628 (+) comp15539_c0_seq3:239-2122(+)